MRPGIPITRILGLFLGLSLYTAIGLLFVIPWLPVRLLIFLVVLLMLGKKAYQPFVWLVSGFFGAMFGLIDSNFTVTTGVLSWIAVAGSLYGVATAYNDIFQGADFASLAKLFPRPKQTPVALTGYYVFKIVPDLRASLSRVAEAEYVYGTRHAQKGRGRIFTLLTQILVTYLLEALALPFSHQRIMERRRDVVVKATVKPKLAENRIFLLMVLVPLIELVGCLYYL